MTFFPSDEGFEKESNPVNCEFAVQVDTPQQVDILFQKMIEAGAQSCWDPEDTEMYDKMRFSCMRDPFGILVDIICPLPE